MEDLLKIYFEAGNTVYKGKGKTRKENAIPITRNLLRNSTIPTITA